jgi:L-threonylcarbamoyladenylate synthase
MNLRIAKAAHTIQTGGVIAYPTEGVWGLGCDPYDRQAVLRILELKQRPVSKGLILVAGSIAQVLPLLQQLTDAQRQVVVDSWPGPNTWIVPVSGLVPEWITGHHASVAIRVTNHPQLQALCLAVGHVIVSTSANRAGRPPATDRVRVQKVFGRDLDYVLAGKTAGRTQPSHIRHAVSGAVIR